MDSYEQDMGEERDYLDKTLAFIKRELDVETGALDDRRHALIASRKDMWENTVHFTNDFARLTEINQYLFEVNNQTASYVNIEKKIEKYKRMIGSPYFGRFDFIEDSLSDREKIYIGLFSVMDSKTHDIFIYDWRAPISSMFYRFEPGRASYTAPSQEISGSILLKRQYKIQNSKLKYFFDCSIRINDEILQEVLGRNSSDKMRNIVETIQKEQDLIIRDTESELLIVHGVAGSGKTSIALHRIAFLLYEGLNSKLTSNNIIIISPNSIFSKYISSVLPELGEDNVEQNTFDDIVSMLFKGRLAAETRNMQLESLIISEDNEAVNLRRQSIEFKGSRDFAKILRSFIQYYERQIIAFEDIYYDGKILETKQELKNLFLNNKLGTPMVKRLKRIEGMILDKIHPLQRKGYEKIQKIVQKSDGHEFEEKSFSRLLSIKRTKRLLERLHSFTEVDFFHIYKLLFSSRELFFKLAQGFILPDNIELILSSTSEMLRKRQILYEDCAPMLYIKQIIEGIDLFPEIRQVVIDEAQDYYPMQYEVFKLLFKDVKYTLLGDINQVIERDTDKSLYDDIAQILDKKKTIKLSLNKSYRSSFEINAFNQKLLSRNQDFISFDRHEAEPMIVYKDTQQLLDQAVAQNINLYLEEGYESIAVICKTEQETKEVQHRLKCMINIKLINNSESIIEKGVLAIPSYLAKGLEFDAVIVYGADRGNYSSSYDKKLLYIACTRALHRLMLYYTGEKSPFI